MTIWSPLSLRAARAALAAACALLAATAGWSPLARAEAPFTPRFEVQEWTLDNGLQVVWVGVRRAPVVAVQLWYRVGAKDEPPGARGAAHLLEHLMVEGSTRVPPGDHQRIIAHVGGTTGAFTTEDVTVYASTVPRGHLPLVLALEADRMRGLVLRADALARAKERVKDERRQRLTAGPLTAGIERLRAVAFTGHPYARTAGATEGIDRLTVADVRRFYEATYRPGQATLVVTGDLPVAQVRDAVTRAFGSLRAKATPARPAQEVREPAPASSRRVVAAPDPAIPGGLVLVGWRVPPAAGDDLAPLQVLARALLDGRDARLSQRLVERERLTGGVHGELQALADGGLLVVAAAPADATRIEALERAILDEVARVAREPLGERELVRARNQLAAEALFALETADGIARRAGAARSLGGEARRFLHDARRFQEVTAADVRRVAGAYLGAQRAVVVVAPPRAAARGGAR